MEILFIMMATVANGTVLAAPPQPLSAVPFTEVKIDDGFWRFWIDLDREKVLPHNLKYCASEGKLDNFLKAAKKMDGKHRGACWEDSDVYKVLEGAAYCLAHRRDPDLEKTLDEIIAHIAAAQQPDGYLDTYFTMVEPDRRWSDDTKHETYCAGHLIEAAIAYHQATGKRALLDVAVKLADHMYAVFGPNKQTDVSEHEEIELALIKLWRHTNDARYLELAKLFLERRGNKAGRKPVPLASRGGWGEVCQDHKPIREQTTIVGHAVRAMYLYCAVTDVAGLTGDAGYLKTLDSIWKDVTVHKMYVTGGIGDSSRGNEGFSIPYFLPNDTAYCETCASVGMALWNQRMALLHRDAKYADIVEREIYNGLLSGVAMSGESFFYCNRLQTSEHRPPWQGCACCPTNIVRFLPTIAGYAYGYDDENVYVNQYVAGRATIPLKGKPVVITQQGQYPWDGRIKITVDPGDKAAFALHLRIPGWCKGARVIGELYTFVDDLSPDAVSIRLNGQAVPKGDIQNGYACFAREWKPGDVLELALPMPVRRVKAPITVKADVGRIAIQRGPIVYAFESVDNDRCVRSLAIPPDAQLTAEHRPDLLGGVTVVKGTALLRLPGTEAPKPFEFTAVPYYAWDNRTPGYMQVWMPEDIGLATPRPLPTLASESTATTSFPNQDTVDALNDQVEPANSGDPNIPRLTWWDHRGTTEWVQYDFKGAHKPNAVEVYWFDDTGRGSCRVPKSWRLLFKDGDVWKPVEGASEYGVRPNTYNRVTFTPVETTALRIEVQLQPVLSGGILEWRVSDAPQ